MTKKKVVKKTPKTVNLLGWIPMNQERPPFEKFIYILKNGRLYIGAFACITNKGYRFVYPGVKFEDWEVEIKATHWKPINIPKIPKHIKPEITVESWSKELQENISGAKKAKVTIEFPDENPKRKYKTKKK